MALCAVVMIEVLHQCALTRPRFACSKLVCYTMTKEAQFITRNPIDMVSFFILKPVREAVPGPFAWAGAPSVKSPCKSAAVSFWYTFETVRHILKAKPGVDDPGKALKGVSLG